MVVFGSINILLFLFIVFFLMPKGSIKKIPFDPNVIIKLFMSQIKPILIIVGIVVFHLIEVKFVDPFTTDLVGYDYANAIVNIENGFVYWFSQHWNPVLLYYFVLIYIVVYPFTLWFSPLYFILGRRKRALKSLAYGLLLIYMISLPFYLFLPITNVYSFYGVESALETVIPSVESFFYLTTTQNNCLPSLHTAMAILVAYCFCLTGNKKLIYFGYFVMVSVLISVVYLSIHWLVDIISGVLLSLGVILLLRHYIKDDV
jgi:membrane-associated phospholipid phosphatase